MAKKRIIAHFMHETEMHAATQSMPGADVTESYVIGDIEEEAIEGLENQGLIVQELPEQAWRPETPGGELAPPDLRRTLRAEFRTAATGPTAAELAAAAEPGFWVIQLRGPLLEPWRSQLQAQKVELLEYLPENGYTAKLTSAQANTVASLPFVESVQPYTDEDTGSISLLLADGGGLGGPDTGQKRMLTYDVRLHRSEDLNTVLTWLQNRQVNVAGAKGRKIRVYVLEGSDVEREIGGLQEVAAVEEYVPPKLYNDAARQLFGVDDGSLNGRVIAETGHDQLVAVADTGLDEHHPDFQGRIVGIMARGRPNDVSDPHGHGTHVAGSILGDGSASAGKLRGVAHEAKLFFQSLLDSSGGLGGLPLDLADLFDEAYQAGARIHNNSWGAATQSMYTFNSIEVDEYVAVHRDMLIVISAGNEGEAAHPAHTRPGFVDWLSIGSPASCKNGLTVGASRSDRTNGGYTKLTYGAAWPNDFPDPPIASQTVSGDAESLAAFSSRGPTDDRRIKPDVVGPGTDIASTKSALAPLWRFWGPYAGNNKYAYMGGTSMSAPLVTGCAALVREYYTRTRNHQPSAALLKATLINSARWLTGQDSTADNVCAPNFHQGFGAVYLPWAIPNPSSPGWKLEFIDSWQDPPNQFTRSGQRFRFRFTVSRGAALRLCLAWTDPPARAIQNNLNLFVQHEGSGQKWMGNENRLTELKIPDPDNNVEVARIDNPAAGSYLVQITATNLLRTNQDFALVVAGDLTNGLALA
jgi:serine protease AprX